jgi:hypothetical protein
VAPNGSGVVQATAKRTAAPTADSLWDDAAVSDADGRTGIPSNAEATTDEPGHAPRGKAPVIDSILLGRSALALTLSFVLLVGLGLLLAGLEVVRASKDWGFSYDGAIAGIVSQLSVTLPAGILVSLATTANILAGAIVLRLAGMPTFHRLSDLVLAGFAAAVIGDSALLFLLGWIGVFGLPELVILHALILGGWFSVRDRVPLMGAPVRLRLSRPLAWWPLVLAIWAGPLIVQLASPAVPFMDVLPNHVAPVEHVRIFGSFSTLTTSPSPIYGPSRLMLGYVALLGQITTITNLDAVLAEAAFAFPLTILVALALRRLAGELFGGSAGFWVLLTFPLTFTFLRIPDARGTVVVFPLAAWALAVAAGELRARVAMAVSAARAADAGAASGSRAAATPFANRLVRPDLALACALGGAFLLHPLVGLVGIVAVVGALILHPVALGRRLVPALGGAAVLAVPQVLTMGGIEMPAVVGFLCVALAAVVAFALAPLVSAIVGRLGSPPALAAEWRALIVLVGIVLLLAAARMHIDVPDDPASELPTDFRLLLLLTVIGAAVSITRLGRGWILLGCGLGAGLAAWAASGFVGHDGLTQQAIHYEVPKSVEYWLPVMLAIGAAAGLAAIMRIRELGLLRAAFVAFVVAISVFPITDPIAIGPVTISGPPVVSPLVTSIKIGEHRGAESLGLALREAELGYWTFYPDARLIINGPRREVVDELLAEVSAGRLGAATKVLNIASSFQQWASVPVGVFTGALETSISLQPELSIHTEGGRLLGFGDLDNELADGGYGYVLLEPSGLSADVISSTQTKLAAAGFARIWSNSQATVYRLG